MNIEENYEENPAPAVTYKTNMQTQNHENSDEFCPAPLRHLDLAPRLVLLP